MIFEDPSYIIETENRNSRVHKVTSNLLTSRIATALMVKYGKTIKPRQQQQKLGWSAKIMPVY